MTRNIRIGSTLAALAAGLLAASAHAAEPSLGLCLDEAADGTLVYAGNAFPNSTGGLMLSVVLGKDHPFKKVAANWVVVDVGGAAPANQIIGKGFLSAQNFERGLFPYRQSRPLPVGKYRVDVLGDDKPWKSVEFSIVAAPAAPAVASPDAFMPLHEGRTWSYSFVQEAGAGLKLDIPAGEKASADGKLRATVTMTVAGKDDTGIRVETSRDGTLAFREWYQLDGRGLVSVKRQGGNSAVVLDPPQLIAKWPLKTQHWDYASRDGAYRQHYSMWGPVPIEWPGGKAAGYIVLLKQETDSRHPVMTVERHYVPGVGMVRETAITAFGDRLINRQEIVLRK